MDFGWALKAMRNGERVRRRAWDDYRFNPREYATLELAAPAEGWCQVLVVTQNDGDRTMYNPSHMQLLAEDWELA